MSINVFNDSANIGPILDNIKNTIVASESILTLDVDDSISPLPISAYGKSILNETSVSSLRNKILDADTAIEITDNGVGEINFDVDNILKMQVTSANTKINNKLLVDNIEDEAGNSVIKSTSASNTTFTKALNTFQLDNVSPTGYISIQHSNSSKSSYIQWYSYDSTGNGSYPRNAYFGLSSHAGGGVNDDLKLSLENNVNFHILKDSTSVMLFDNANNKIIVSNPMDLNNNLTINNAKTQYVYDDTHTIGSERNKDNIKNSIWGLNNSASDFGTLSICAGGSQNKNNKSRVQLYGYGMSEKIQMLIGDNKLYTCTDTQNTFYRPIYVNWNGGNGKKMTIQGGNCDYSLYTSSVFGGEINIAHNISYTPYTEVEGVTTNSLFTSKIIVSNQGIKFRHSDTVNTLPTTDIATFNNSSATFNKDVIIDGINKLNFNSSNYIQNDSNDHLNMVLATDKNFVANTTTDKSSYEFKIAGNSVMKMTRDLTSNPTSNKTQLSSEELLIRDNNIAGGSISIQRSGPSQLFTAYINYFVNNNGNNSRLFYTGFNDTGIFGNPIHYMEDICKSYSFKNSLGIIMKIHSHSGTIGANTDYVEIGNRLECPNIQLPGPNNTGALYCRDDGANNTNADNVSLNYNIALNRATNVESAILATEKTSKISLNQFAIQFKMSSAVGVLPSTIFEVNPINVAVFKNLIPSATNTIDLGIDNGSLLSRFRDCYLTQNLDIAGTSGRVIMTDSSIADNTIRDNGVCGNTIVGVKSKTSDTGVGFLRLAAGIELTSQINETYIDLYGSNTTGTYQSIRHVVNNSEMFVIENNKAEFKNTLYTTHIYPSSAPTTNPHTDSLYDIGTDVTRYRDIYTRDAPTHGSDMRLKKNIVPLQNSLSTILKLQPKLFQWISSESNRNHIGFLAQHIEQIPELANTGYFCKSKDGSTMSLRSSELIPVLTGAIKELYDIVTSSTDKPVIIKQEVKSTQDHKCNNIELISQLNSYELELLDCNSKVKELDSNIEELCEDNTLLKEDNNILKIKNKGLEERICKLELSNKQLLEKLENIDNKKDDNLLTEDDENSSVMDIMNQRFLELEARLIKTEKKNAKLVSTINKMLKEK